MKRLVVVTGLSGSGKSVAAKTLEDLGYLCVDNLPAVMLPQFVQLLGSVRDRAAVVVDVRQPGFLGRFREILESVRERGTTTEVLFLESSDLSLIKRFSESRRPHPLASSGPIAEGIGSERELLADLKESADEVVDTSAMTVHDLRRHLREMYAPQESDVGLRVTTVSFGFKYGIPPEANLAYDVRFLPNPYWDENLRSLSGQDQAVREAVLGGGKARTFIDLMRRNLEFLLPHYAEEGRGYLTVAIGCTGGRHRSVVLATGLAELVDRMGYPSQLVHRDIKREG